MLSPDGADGDRFGLVLDIDSGFVAVGAPYKRVDGARVGEALVYNADNGQFLHRLVPDVPGLGFIGVTLASDAGRTVVGAQGGAPEGWVYLFDTASGALIRRLAPPAVAGGELRIRTVDIQGDIVVGTWILRDDLTGDDTYHTYVLDAATNSVLHELVATNEVIADEGSPIGEGIRMGSSISISGDRVIVGHLYDDELGVNAGAAFVFDLTTGQQLRKLIAPDGAFNEFFGVSVALDADHAIVGASKHNAGPTGETGAAYVYDVTNGAMIFKLEPDAEPSSRHLFGVWVDMNQSVIVVGASQEHVIGNDSGAVYTFHRESGTPQHKLLSEDLAARDNFGASVAVDGSTVVAAAIDDDDFGSMSGSAYVFDACFSTNPADLDGNGAVDSGDLAVLLAAWGGPSADLDGDSATGSSDLAILLAAWGCS